MHASEELRYPKELARVQSMAVKIAIVAIAELRERNEHLTALLWWSAALNDFVLFEHQARWGIQHKPSLNEIEDKQYGDDFRSELRHQLREMRPSKTIDWDAEKAKAGMR